MTEEEAKTKWCSFVRLRWAKLTGEGEAWATSDVGSFNRAQIEYAQTVHRPVGTNCIGSECMAWRFHSYMERVPDGPKPKGNGWVHTPPLWSREHVSKNGYCGLAGKP